ncbi:MAG: TIGR01906 family membrane protein [Lachnotalea sp.]
MNKLGWGIGIFGSMALIVVLFLTSFKFVLYHDINFYEKEYSKYNVLDAVKMEMKDVLYVTEEMMDYLIDKRADLVVETVVDGNEREFFNDREKLHMQDVKSLFMDGLMIRRIALAITIVSLLLLVFMKVNLLRIISRSFLIATVLVATILGISAIYISSNFNAVFIEFHHLFFNNDYWILNPETDLMINILPENFFFDVVKSVGLTFGVLLAILLIVAVIINTTQWHKKYKSIH